MPRRPCPTTSEIASNAALTVISQAEIRPVREAAIAAIDAAMQGETSDYYKDMMVQEISKQSTEKESLGLAQMLYEQMKRNYDM